MSDKTKHDDGGIAFPTPDCSEWDADERTKGMTLHDHYIGKIMEGLMANPARYGYIKRLIEKGMTQEEASVKNVNKAFMIADAMIAEKRRREGGE